MKIERNRDRWNNMCYTCMECNNAGNTISSINHNINCSISKPDDVKYPFHKSTKKLIRNIIQDVKWKWNNVEYTQELDSLTDIRGVHWDRRGSSNRIALGIGQTSQRGQFHMDDKRGLVLKIEPDIRWNIDQTAISGNINELKTWYKAKETSTTNLFGEIITHSSDGMWLIMEECIPIYKSMGNITGDCNAIFDNRGEEYIHPLISKLGRNNWVKPDYKHGNIGLNDIGNPVVIDYGTGPKYIQNYSE